MKKQWIWPNSFIARFRHWTDLSSYYQAITRYSYPVPNITIPLLFHFFKANKKKIDLSLPSFCIKRFPLSRQTNPDPPHTSRGLSTILLVTQKNKSESVVCHSETLRSLKVTAILSLITKYYNKK